MHKVVHRTIGAILLTGLLTVALASAAPAAERTTTVDHDVTFSLTAPDDICGPYPAEITFSVRTQALHWTEEADRFNVQFTQTGTYHVDFADPTRRDQDSQYTDSIHHVLTPGKVEVFNETFHDFPDGIKIWVRIHAAIVDGRLVVERVVERVTGCPS